MSCNGELERVFMEVIVFNDVEYAYVVDFWIIHELFVLSSIFLKKI